MINGQRKPSNDGGRRNKLLGRINYRTQKQTKIKNISIGNRKLRAIDKGLMRNSDKQIKILERYRA